MCSTPRDSPPCGKRRRLDISDVSSLINAKHTASFTSPERLREQPQLAHSTQPHNVGNQSGRQTEMNTLSKELLEEDTCIQCSFPPYLDHVFGVCIGSSQLTHCSPIHAHNHTPNTEHNALTTIVESQGFTVTGLPSDCEVSSKSDEEKCLQSSPVLFPSPVLPSQSPPSASSVPPAPPTCPPHTSHYGAQHQIEPVVAVLQTPPTEPKQLKLPVHTCRKRKRSPVSKATYQCPPSCILLVDCTQEKVESIVCLFGLVLQGTCISRPSSAVQTLLW